MRTAMADRAYNLLRARIIDLELLPGARLRTERLSADFDVSPTPVREALNRLAAEGMVIQEPYRGFRVSDLIDADELVQLLRAREVIEAAAVEQTAISKDSAVLPELRGLTDRMEELASASELDIKAYNAADAEFHRLTVSASGNRFLLDALDALHVHVQIARHYQGKSVEEARLSNEDHRQLLASIERGDSAGACACVRAHISRVTARLTLRVSDTENQAIA